MWQQSPKDPGKGRHKQFRREYVCTIRASSIDAASTESEQNLGGFSSVFLLCHHCDSFLVASMTFYDAAVCQRVHIKGWIDGTEFYGVRKGVEEVVQHVQEILASSGMDEQQSRLADLEQQTSESSLWDDPAHAQQTLSALTEVKDNLALLHQMQAKVLLFFTT